MSWFGRAELGETDDPTELVPGSPAAIDESASNMRKLAKAFQEADDGLRKLDMNDWQGAAAEKFNSYFADELPKWTDAAEAFVPAADALTTYKGAVERAQRDAAEAIRLYNEAKQATEQARKQYEAAADAHDRATFNATFSNEPAPAPMAPFSDPGQAKRESAQRLLDDARRTLKAAAGEAAAAINKAKDRAPEKPGLLSQLGAMAEDVFDGVMSAQASMRSGALEAVGDLVKVARAGNPLDPYNMTHPGDYAANMATMASGMVHTATHPGEAIGKILQFDEWKKDPFAAVGKVGVDIAIGAVTGGTGTAATAAKTVGKEAAEAGIREAMEQVGTKVAREADNLPPWHRDGVPDHHGWDDYKPDGDEPFGPKGSDPEVPHDREPEHKEPDRPTEEQKQPEPDERPKITEPEQLPQPDRSHYFQLKDSVARIQDNLPTLSGAERVAQERLMIEQRQMMRDIMNRHR